MLVEWIVIAASLVPMVFCPTKLFNGFGLPQTVALGTLSTLGLIAGLAGGTLPTGLPAIFSILFLIYMALSLTWIFPIHNGKKEFGLQAPLVVLFLVALGTMTVNSVTYFALGISLTAALCSIYAIGQTYGIDYLFPNDVKAGGDSKNPIGTIGNTNFLASFLCAVFWWTIYSGFAVSPFLWIVSLIVLYTLYRTYSRAGQLGVLGSLVFLFVVMTYYEKLPFPIDSGFWFPVEIILILSFVFALVILLIVKWQTFFHKPIDPLGAQVWYASFRFRLCYWWAAWELIKLKPIFGWGMWSYRRNVYGAQAKIHEKYPWFLNPDRYLTPQPRECHNDFIEHIVEFGVVGFSLFLCFLSVVYYYGLKGLGASNGSEMILILCLLGALTGILIDAFFFFALRLPSTGLVFWMTCAALMVISGGNLVSEFSIHPVIIIFSILFSAAFLWECIIKRALSSYWFVVSRNSKSGDKERFQAFEKAVEYAPFDSILRTYATISLLNQGEPEMASFHAQKLIEHYDGMNPLQVSLFNIGLVKARIRNAYDEALVYLKKSHFILPFFGPSLELLNSEDGVDVRSKYRGGAAYMKIASESTQWKIRAMFLEKQNNELRREIANKELESITLKDQLLEANIQNCLMAEKRQLNIPDFWIYQVDKGDFVSPEDARTDSKGNVTMGDRPGIYKGDTGVMMPSQDQSGQGQQPPQGSIGKQQGQ